MRRFYWLIGVVLWGVPGRAGAQEALWGGARVGGPMALSLSFWRGGDWGAWVGLRLPLGVGGATEAATVREGTGREASGGGAGPGRLSPGRMSKLLRGAWRAAGVSDARVDDLATRARRAALLPEVRVRGVWGSDQALRYTPQTDDDLRAQSTGQATALYEVRLAFRLDRLMFADEEVALERLRQEQAQQRARVTQRLTELLGGWQRSRARLRVTTLTDEERQEAEAAVEAAEVALDLLTDGVWSATAEAR